LAESDVLVDSTTVSSTLATPPEPWTLTPPCLSQHRG